MVTEQWVRWWKWAGKEGPKSDKCVLNSVWESFNTYLWWQEYLQVNTKARGLNITLHRGGGIITPILAWDSLLSDPSPSALVANTTALSLAGPFWRVYNFSLRWSLSRACYRNKGREVAWMRAQSRPHLWTDTFPPDNRRLVGQRWEEHMPLLQGGSHGKFCESNCSLRTGAHSNAEAWET